MWFSKQQPDMTLVVSGKVYTCYMARSVGHVDLMLRRLVALRLKRYAWANEPGVDTDEAIRHLSQVMDINDDIDALLDARNALTRAFRSAA